MSRQQGNVIFPHARKKGRAARIIGRRSKRHARLRRTAAGGDNYRDGDEAGSAHMVHSPAEQAT